MRRPKPIKMLRNGRIKKPVSPRKPVLSEKSDSGSKRQGNPDQRRISHHPGDIPSHHTPLLPQSSAPTGFQARILPARGQFYQVMEGETPG